MDNEMWEVFIAGFAEMNLIPIPRKITLVPILRLMVILRAKGTMRWWQIIFVAHSDHTLFPVKLLYPGLAESFNGWEGAPSVEPDRSTDGYSKRPILPDLFHHIVLLAFRPRNAPFFNPAAVAFKPLLGNPTAQPIGMVFGERIEGST